MVVLLLFKLKTNRRTLKDHSSIRKCVFLRVVVARILLINSLYKMSGLAPLDEQYTNTKALLFYMLQA